STCFFFAQVEFLAWAGAISRTLRLSVIGLERGRIPLTGHPPHQFNHLFKLACSWGEDNSRHTCWFIVLKAEGEPGNLLLQSCAPPITTYGHQVYSPSSSRTSASP